MSDEILRATWRALCSHGYAELTMQDIADESTKSKAAIHYHFDSKRDLLVAFLDHVSERFMRRLREADPGPAADAPTRLSAVLDAALDPPETDDIEDMQTALLELKAQAPHEPAYRERIRESDERFRGLLADILAAGVESGTVRSDVDPEASARFVVNVLGGAQLRQVSVGQDAATARALLDEHLDARVYRREATAE